MSNCKPGVWKFFLTCRYLNKGMPSACFWSISWGERCRRLRCAPEPCTPRAQWTFHHGRGRRSMSRFPASQRHTGKTSARKTGQFNTTLTRCTPLEETKHVTPWRWTDGGDEWTRSHTDSAWGPGCVLWYSRSLMEEMYHTLSKNWG